jgi:hypothetical protein
MEARIKALLGEMNFTIIALQTQLEAAQNKIKELEAPKEAEPKAD